MDLLQSVRFGIVVLILSAQTPAFAHDSTLAEQTAEQREFCEEHLVNVKAEDEAAFSGMSARGFERLMKAQTALKTVTANFNTNFESMQGILETELLTMATRENSLMLGPPGGAKSAHLSWLIPGIWTKQLHELMTDSALFGGQTEKATLEGREGRNHEGSVINAEYVMLDEATNANPMLAASVLSYLNPGERFITENGKQIPAKTRAVFSTGNATRAQILKSYAERGLSTGPAMLNRSIFKAWVPNWLSADEQVRRDKIIARVNHLKSVQKYGAPEEQQKAAALLKGLQSERIDMRAIEAFAQHAFQPHPDLVAAVREYANEFRKQINAKILTSDQAHREDPNRNPLVKTPSADWTERFRTSLMRTIVFSAALDYLRMIDASGLDPKLLNKPIVLKPMSLWRAIYATTTIGPGENRFNPRTMSVDFNMIRNNKGKLQPSDHAGLLAGCKDVMETEELNFMWEEQDLANTIMSGIMGRMSKEAKELAPFMPQTEDLLLNLEDADFEVLNYRFLQQTRP